MISESRCPTGAQCPWAGQAIIGVTFEEEGGSPADLQLVIPGFVDAGTGDGYQPLDTLGFRLTLLELEPYPTVDSPAPDTTSTAAIRVERL